MADTHAMTDAQIVAALQAPLPGWLTALGGRKFAVALLALLSVTALTAFGRLDGSAYVTVVVAVVGLYGAANVTQRALATKAAS